jgi:hypothetical protein
VILYDRTFTEVHEYNIPRLNKEELILQQELDWFFPMTMCFAILYLQQTYNYYFPYPDPF